MKTFKIIHAGDSSAFCRFSEKIDPDVSNTITSFHSFISSGSFPGLIETVPSYTGLMVYYDPLIVIDIESQLNELYNKHGSLYSNTLSRLVRVPICYSTEFALDIETISVHSGLSNDEIIELHTGSEYLVFMLGFTPGFPYMGGLHESLAIPRKKDPRTRVSEGSVGIAGNQTGIYPIESPGGWQIIGRTPLKLFDPGKSEKFLFRSGDRVKFYPITNKEFILIEEQVRNDSFKLDINIKDERN